MKRLVCAHECGLVINPEGLRRTIEGAMLHSLSRALHEEVQFDGEKVTSVDWRSHPTLTHVDTPAKIDIVLINGDPNPHRPDLPHYGAGEAACKPMIAAVANAIYDATGVRIRRVPFRNVRVLGALKAAGVERRKILARVALRGFSVTLLEFFSAAARAGFIPCNFPGRRISRDGHYVQLGLLKDRRP